MSDFTFLQNLPANQWVILAPRRAKRPDQGTVLHVSTCPFCPGAEPPEKTLYQIPSSSINHQASTVKNPLLLGEGRVKSSDKDKINPSTSLREEADPSVSAVHENDNVSTWDVKVLANKYPFSQIHEVIIHSPDHHKNFAELPLEHVEKIIQCYKDRYNTHKDKGAVYIFHNFGERAGESLPHPHSQLVVIPHDVRTDIPPLSFADEEHTTDHFTIFCPQTSQWPDEVWVAPKVQGFFGDINGLQQRDLSFTLKRLIEIFSLRHGQEFPFNFYIYPYKNWYIRIIPRVKRLGGFEVGTNIFVNTQDPKETIAFIKEHFILPDREKILKDHRAGYHEGV